jgi:hypothetical protein
MRSPTVESRKGTLTGPQVAECLVTISRIDGVMSSLRISDVSPRAQDGVYKLTVAGESSASRWRKDSNGWMMLT